ncbi:hypothetical protein AVEN_240974-1, partial [Araneus ventricosus]
AKAAPGMHSMHITLSTNQLNTWGDFLEHALTNAIEDATENDIEFRKSIPKDYLNYMGRIYSDTVSILAQVFFQQQLGVHTINLGNSIMISNFVITTLTLITCELPYISMC